MQERETCNWGNTMGCYINHLFFTVHATNNTFIVMMPDICRASNVGLLGTKKRQFFTLLMEVKGEVAIIIDKSICFPLQPPYQAPSKIPTQVYYIICIATRSKECLKQVAWANLSHNAATFITLDYASVMHAGLSLHNSKSGVYSYNSTCNQCARWAMFWAFGVHVRQSYYEYITPSSLSPIQQVLPEYQQVSSALPQPQHQQVYLYTYPQMLQLQ